jgi:hypothetical protein
LQFVEVSSQAIGLPQLTAAQQMVGAIGAQEQGSLFLPIAQTGAQNPHQSSHGQTIALTDFILGQATGGNRFMKNGSAGGDLGPSAL